ncbi:MAG: MFS transporter [Actinomycetia bacterium]|nr:MFS transporter [Actinomycetes bacterium]MCP3993317.1 MFS transporter [Actinomycetes bacterium]MCP4087983.1 MFS transporter [Actinomycetes bacterium]
MPPSPPTGPPETHVERHAWLALGVATLVTFLIVVDISAVNVAFPTMTEDLDATRSELSWVVSGYNITVGALLLSAGRFADSHGRRRVFLPGVAIFALGSALSGLAPTAGFLIAARVLQALGGAITMAASMAVVLPDFPPARRSTAIGFMGATGGLGAVAGPMLGSLLIDLFSWRAIFLINVPISVLILVLAPRLLRESSDPNATGNIDLIGVLIGTASVALVMFGIVQSEDWGISDLRVWVLVATGLALFPILIRRSRTHPEPLVNLDLFRFRSFASTNLSVVFYGLAFTSGFLVNSLLLQDLWGQSVRATGLALAPSPIISALVSPVSGSIADRFGHRWVLGIGSLCLASSYLAYAVFLGETPEVWSRFVPFSLLGGVGVGLTVATWTSAGLSDVPPANFGVAGATFNTVRQMTYALGISVAITLVATSDVLDISGYRLAWIWNTVCYATCAAVVMVTFPSGSSHDRAVSRAG